MVVTLPMKPASGLTSGMSDLMALEVVSMNHFSGLKAGEGVVMREGSWRW